MNKAFADGLREALKEAVPQPGRNRYATGQLRDSIQEAQPYGMNGYIITIGNGTAQTRKVPSNVYASITNNSKNLLIPVGKRGESSLRKIVANPNYHWATDCIKKYVQENKQKLVVNILEDTDDE